MRKKVFFSHLIEVDPLIMLVEEILQAEKEKLEILDMIDSTLHHRIVDRILQELDEQHHEIFMHEYSQNPSNEEILVFLKKQIPDIEKVICNEAQLTQASLFEDIKKLKK